MKKLFLIAACVWGSVHLSAQENFGIKASVGMVTAGSQTTYAGEVFDYINHAVTYEESNIVKSIGVFGQKKFGFLFGRAELAYTTYDQRYLVKSYVQFGTPDRNVTERYHFIDFQMLAGLNVGNFRIGMGPVAHILAGSNSPLDFISGYRERRRGMTYGYTMGIGLDAGNLHVDLRYENNFRTVGDHIFYGTRQARFTEKPNVLSITFGLSI